jgi:hypothetical protein
MFGETLLDMRSPEAINETLLDMHPPQHVVEGGRPAVKRRFTLTPDHEPEIVFRDPPQTRRLGPWRVAAVVACIMWALLPLTVILGTVGVQPVTVVVASLPAYLLLFAVPALITVLALLFRVPMQQAAATSG